MTFTKPIDKQESQPLTYVLGIDPGVSTGIAFAFKQEDKWKYATSTIQTPEEVWQHIVRPQSGRMVVVCERFHAQLISRFGLHTVDIIGGIKALCWQKGIEIVLDTPQQRKPFLKKAKELVTPHGDLTQHDLRHEADAMSHVVRYLYYEGIISII